eukprot:XP_016657527.1 PREDICTED: small ubiquitin-related modifier-like isoform X2 [Acyrthosiphon pisum]
MSADEEASKSLPSNSKTIAVSTEQNKEGAVNTNAGALKVTDEKAPAANEYICLHIITSDFTNEVRFRVKAGSAFIRLKRSYCSKMGFEVDQVRFMFDGYRITDDDTALKLGMTDNDIVEIYQEKTGGGM